MDILRIVIYIFIWLPFAVAAQDSRGAKPLQNQTGFDGTTRALVVGISEYKFIEDLNFADEDALEFYHYLRSRAGGSVDSANIHLLINDKAKGGDLFQSLGWLLDESKPGDRVIIYFAGHGDVETRTIAKRGYLLAHDTPKNVYVAGGLEVSIVQDYLNTMSTNDVQVIFYADACRSGNLAGGKQGATLTNEALQQQIQNQIKVLSCQSGELSLEGEEWGGGRGVFSYHLIRGLTGVADGDNSEEVTLNELYMHLLQTVPAEAKPLSQFPVVKGDMSIPLAAVDEKSLALLLDSNGEDDYLMSYLETRGLDTDIPISLQDEYKKFKDYLANDILWVPDAECAWSVLADFPAEAVSENVFKMMQRQLAAALQNNAQTVINQYVSGELNALKTDLEDEYLFSAPVEQQRQFFAFAATEMQLTRTLLGPEHILAPYLEARQLFLEARSMVGTTDQQEIDHAVDMLQKSIELEPSAAYSFNTLGIFKYSKGENEAAITEFEKARELAPTWANPVANIGNTLNSMGKMEEALTYYDKALEIDPNYFYTYSDIGVTHAKLEDYEKALDALDKSLEYDEHNAMTWNYLGTVKYYMNDLEAAESAYERSLELDPTYAIAHKNMGLVKKAEADLVAASYHFNQAVELDPGYAGAFFEIGDLYFLNGDLESAIDQYQKSLEIDPGFWRSSFNLGNAFYDLGQYASAIESYNDVIELFPDQFVNGYYNIACAYSLSGNTGEALRWLEQAFEKGYTNLENVQTDADLEAVRAEPGFEPLIQEYFNND